MSYKTVFDITESVSGLSSARLIAAFFLFVGLIIIATFFLKDNQYKDVFSGKAKAIKKLIIGGGLIAVSLSVIITITIIINSDLYEAIRNGNIETVEGQVGNFDPMPVEGHKQESFDVGGVHFEYSDYSLFIQGYHNAASHGGVIRPNLQVRIKYYQDYYEKRILAGNKIVKLEIQDSN